MKCAARYSLCTSFGTEEPDFFERPKKQKAWAINLWKETICIYFSHARKKQISMHYVPNTEPNRTEPKPTRNPWTGTAREPTRAYIANTTNRSRFELNRTETRVKPRVRAPLPNFCSVAFTAFFTSGLVLLHSWLKVSACTPVSKPVRPLLASENLILENSAKCLSHWFAAEKPRQGSRKGWAQRS